MGDSGFTLIEVVVALAIAALGLALLMKAVGSSGESVAVADREIRAVSLAQSHLAAVVHESPLKKGDYSGDDGGGFRWHIHIANPLSHASPGGTAALYPVTVIESWRAGASQKTISLYSERVALP